MAASAKVARTLLPTFILVLALSGLGVTRGHEPSAPGRATEQIGVDGIPECPFETEKRYEFSVSVADPIRDIPEYHDCQRLVQPMTPETAGASPPGSGGPSVESAVASLRESMGEPSPETYGPLVAIYASARLDSIAADLLLAARERKASGGSAERGVAAAHIYDWESIPYAPLGIRPGHNCLFLYGPIATPSAFLLPVTDPGVCKRHPPADTTGAVPLRVMVRKHSNFVKAAQYPAVARWVTDLARHTWIAIGCGAAMCLVGPDDGGTSGAPPAWGTEPPVTSIPASLLATRSRYAIYGWYDQQRLWHLRSDGTPAPMGSPARVVPVETLGQINDTLKFAGKWIHVATIWLDHEDSTYKSKLNLHAGENRLYLTLFRSGKRRGWWADIEPGSTMPNSLRFHVVRRGHEHHLPKVMIPATARWRWMRNDETIWTRCAAGCCEVQAQPGTLPSSSPSDSGP